MQVRKLLTKNYKHDYWFEFNGKAYRVNSIVKLTEKGRGYLKSRTREVILKEHFIGPSNKEMWKYEFNGQSLTEGITNVSTNRHPDELIEEVVIPATYEYSSREIFGVNSSEYNNGEKNSKKDLYIPEVRRAWIIYIIFFIAVAIFKDWYVKVALRIVAGFILGVYRQEYVNAYTTYTHKEDDEIIKKKYEILYGICSKENGENE